MTTPQRPAPMRDSKSSLYEAALAAVKEREEAAVRGSDAPRPKPRSRWVLVMLLIGWAGAILLLLRPTWLAGPTVPPPDPPTIAAASLRLSLLRERQRIVDYSRLHGRLPPTLREAGVTRIDLRYQTAGPKGFTLSARAGDSLITLRSSDSTSVFLGRSLRLIKNRRAR